MASDADQLLPAARRPPARLGRIAVAAGLCAAVAAGVAVWLNARGQPAQPMPIAPLHLWYGDQQIRGDQPIGSDPFAGGGAVVPLDTAARITGFTILLPRGDRPHSVWFDAASGATVVVDDPQGRLRVAERPSADCCSVDVTTSTGLAQEAATMRGARVTAIGGFPALVAPPGIRTKGWYVQVGRPATEVIAYAPRTVTLAAIEQVLATLRPFQLQHGR